jgi:hypothetical protein
MRVTNSIFGACHINGLNTVTTEDDRTILHSLSLIIDCYKYIMDVIKNGVLILDAIKFVQRNKEKLAMSKKENDGQGI